MQFKKCFWVNISQDFSPYPHLGSIKMFNLKFSEMLSNNLSLTYQNCTPSRYKDIGIRKLESWQNSVYLFTFNLRLM